MPKYVVREGEQVQRNGRLYPEGKVLDLTPEEAEGMDWAVEPVAVEKPKAEPKKAPAKKKAAKKTASKK